MTFFRPAIVLLTAFALSACVQQPVKRNDAEISAKWRLHQQANSDVRQWHIDGRINLENGHQSWNAALIWRRKTAKYDLRLVGPLGAGSVLIKGNRDGVTLRTSKGETVRAKDPDSLIHRAMGWRLPVRSLEYWVRGLPEPGDVVMHWDHRGRLSSLLQHGWDVQFSDYRDQQPNLPGRVELLKGDWHIQLIINRWKV